VILRLTYCTVTYSTDFVYVQVKLIQKSSNCLHLLLNPYRRCCVYSGVSGTRLSRKRSSSSVYASWTLIFPLRHRPTRVRDRCECVGQGPGPLIVYELSSDLEDYVVSLVTPRLGLGPMRSWGRSSKTTYTVDPSSLFSSPRSSGLRNWRPSQWHPVCAQGSEGTSRRNNPTKAHTTNQVGGASRASRITPQTCRRSDTGTSSGIQGTTLKPLRLPIEIEVGSSWREER
jgi:hypothetical protein